MEQCDLNLAWPPHPAPPQDNRPLLPLPLPHHLKAGLGITGHAEEGSSTGSGRGLQKDGQDPVRPMWRPAWLQGQDVVGREVAFKSQRRCGSHLCSVFFCGAKYPAGLAGPQEAWVLPLPHKLPESRSCPQSSAAASRE